MARHSKQIPMPHNGPRRSPTTDVRHAWFAIIMATATVVPSRTEIGVPFTFNLMSSDMANFRLQISDCRFKKSGQMCKGSQSAI
jgi:hypothetical protein